MTSYLQIFSSILRLVSLIFLMMLSGKHSSPINPAHACHDLLKVSENRMFYTAKQFSFSHLVGSGRHVFQRQNNVNVKAGLLYNSAPFLPS